MGVTVAGKEPAKADLAVPDAWTCERLGPARFRLFCGGAVEPRSTVTVSVPSLGSAGFTVLGPDEAQGFPAGDNVTKCPKCQARAEACICEAAGKA